MEASASSRASNGGDQAATDDTLPVRPLRRKVLLGSGVVVHHGLLQILLNRVEHRHEIARHPPLLLIQAPTHTPALPSLGTSVNGTRDHPLGNAPAPPADPAVWGINIPHETNACASAIVRAGAVLTCRPLPGVREGHKRSQPIAIQWVAGRDADLRVHQRERSMHGAESDVPGGVLLRQVRFKAGLSFADVVGRLDERDIRIDAAHLQRIEAGPIARPTTDTIGAILHAGLQAPYRTGQDVLDTFGSRLPRSLPGEREIAEGCRRHGPELPGTTWPVFLMGYGQGLREWIRPAPRLLGPSPADPSPSHPRPHLPRPRLRPGVRDGRTDRQPPGRRAAEGADGRDPDAGSPSRAVVRRVDGVDGPLARPSRRAGRACRTGRSECWPPDRSCRSPSAFPASTTHYGSAPRPLLSRSISASRSSAGSRSVPRPCAPASDGPRQRAKREDDHA